MNTRCTGFGRSRLDWLNILLRGRASGVYGIVRDTTGGLWMNYGRVFGDRRLFDHGPT